MSADRVIAIDGPAGSGKSTVARTVADKLHMAHLDTGAMYRGVAFAAIEAKIDLEDGDALDALAARVEMSFDGDRIFVDGTDATEAIRGQAVSTAVSPVATNAGVRAELVRRQRAWAAEHDGGVIEGRDIGTAVFPDAPVKVFLTATPDERARRRAGETDGVDVEVLAAQIAERDLRDSTRAVNPMRPADDGVEIDTTEMTLAEVVDAVLAIVPWSVRGERGEPASASRPTELDVVEDVAVGTGVEPPAPRQRAMQGRAVQPVTEAPPLSLGARVGYGLISATTRGLAKGLYRNEIVGMERLPRTGPYILAPSHRSGMDFLFAAMVTRRRVRWMAKESLWKYPSLGSFVDVMGGFRVNRGTADRVAVQPRGQPPRGGGDPPVAGTSRVGQRRGLGHRLHRAPLHGSRAGRRRLDARPDGHVLDDVRFGGVGSAGGFGRFATFASFARFARFARFEPGHDGEHLVDHLGEGHLGGIDLHAVVGRAHRVDRPGGIA